MYAVVVTDLGGPEVLAYTQVAKPVPGPKQVLIKVEAASVNFADIKARYGNKGGKQPPFIPGMDAAGTIEEIGSDVKDFHIGQRVIAFPTGGSYADYAVADAILTYGLPDGVDMAAAAACPIVAFTSYKLIAEVARMAPGETVLVHAAAGGVGTTVIQIAKLLGAGKVIGTVSSKEKVATALATGADEVINLANDDFVESVLAQTEGRGADVILDSIGGNITEKGLRCLAKFGRLVQFGNASGEYANINTKELHASCRSVVGFSFGTTRAERPHLIRDTADKVLSLLENGSLRMMIGHRLPLEEARQAQDLIEKRASNGKILLIPEQSSLRKF